LKTEEVLTIETIKQRYPDEWVIVVDYAIDEKTTTPIEGKVLMHSKSREEVYRRLETLQDRSACVFCTGELPKDTGIMFL